MKSFATRIYQSLNSTRFFKIVLVFFGFESIWIAVSAVYPQAFDENFHFGLIQLYSHYWLPFLSSQPPHAYAYGAVARDPSYLYQYLMSFPYRLIALFTHRQTIQVILLRFINIGLFGWGLILFRRILLRVGISRALANISVAIFILIPISPQLAAEINYDNLFIPLTAWAILLTFDVTDQLRKKQPSVKSLLLLLSLCLLTSLVKYAFLPIFLGIVIFLVVIGIKSYHKKLRKLMLHLAKDWKRHSVRLKVLIVSLFLLSAGMFIQRDGINLIKYHSVAPDCGIVLNVKDCSAYSAWDYSYTSHQQLEAQMKTGNVGFMNIFSYSMEWIYWMWYRLFFAVNGPASGFTNYPPLTLPSAAAIILLVVGVIALIKGWRRIFRNNVYLVLLFLVSFLYITALFAQGYSSYHYTNILENMNGRYLLPVLLFVAAIIGRGLSIELRKAAIYKSLLVAIVLVLFLEGGGFLTFIARSDDTWDVNNSVVKKVNDTARRITDPVIINGSKQYDTKIWFFN